jgi:uncharacterized protein YjiK
VRWLIGATCAAVLVLTIFSRALAPVPQPVGSAAAPQSGLEGFDLRPSAAVQATLPRSLQEVSGLAVSPDGRLFTHDDERAVIRQVDAGGSVLKSFSLGAPVLPGDFEGLAIAENRFFLITSTGQLFETHEGEDGASVRFTVRRTRFGAICELEGLAFDPNDRILLVGCKRPAGAALAGRVTLFRWSLDRAAPAVPDRLSVPLADAVRGTGGKQFSIAAVERDPRTGNYVLVAGPQRLLAELTPAGVVVATRALDRRLHTQPEGIAFLGDTLLLIADEGGSRRGTLTAYRRAR